MTSEERYDESRALAKELLAHLRERCEAREDGEIVARIASAILFCGMNTGCSREQLHTIIDTVRALHGYG